MNNIAQQLADALRRVLPYAENVADDAFNIDTAPGQDDVSIAMRALAAFDAQKATERAPAGDHTAEPWRYNLHHVQTADEVIGVLPRAANARRIVACVNACAGIPTEHLEFIAPVGLKAVADKWGGA